MGGGGAKRLTVSHYIIDWILHTNCLITKIYVVVAYKLEANSTTLYIPFLFFFFAVIFLYKKYYMEQGHYNPKIRVMKIND